MGDEQIVGFGQALKQQRMAAGMRQLDLVEALDRVIARSTLANVEVGRENPSARLWEAICRARPDWVDALRPWYRSAQPGAVPPFEVAGPFELLEARYVYTFRDHRSPEEIVLVRRVRALADGADGYGLSVSGQSGHFDVDTESLFGGWIERHSDTRGHDSSRTLTRFHFDRSLERGEEHEFATRGWVSQHEPDTSVSLQVTRPTREAIVVLNFMGPRPRQVWRFNGTNLADGSQGPTCPADLIGLRVDGSCTLQIANPEPWHVYGLAWQW